MTPSQLMWVLGVAALSLGLRTYQNTLAQKLSGAGIMATSFLLGWFLTGSPLAGAFCALSWLLLPWLEILTRVRHMRLPREKNLRHRSPPNAEVFPALSDLTEEVEQEGFEHTEDAGWEWDEYKQFFRLFYHPGRRTQAAICLIEQEHIAFFYVSLSSRGCDGQIWMTFNYPFSYALKPVPLMRINRVRAECSFLQMAELHARFLKRHGIGLEQIGELEPEALRDEIQQDLTAQISHNVASGVLQPASESEVRYSWRGLFFLWWQFLRDLVRL